MKFLPIALGLALAVSPGAAQAGEATKRKPGDATKKTTWPGGKIPKPTYTYTLRGIIETTYHADESKTTERVVPPAEIKQMRAKKLIPMILGDELFSVVASIRPRRLAPGERGTVHLIVMLREDFVVLANSKISVVVDESKLPVRLGRTEVAKPRSSRRLPKSRGFAVYDDQIEIKVPVTIRTDATHEKHPISGHVELELHHAKTGELLGVFFSSMHGWVTVGKSLRPVPATGRPDEPSSDGAEQASGTASTIGTGTLTERDDGASDRETTGGQGRRELTPSQPGAARSGSTAVNVRPGIGLLFGLVGLLVLGLLIVIIVRSRS